MAANNQIVEYDLIIKAQESINSLTKLSEKGVEFNTLMMKLSATVDKFAKSSGKAWRDVLSQFQQLDRLAEVGGGGLFKFQGGNKVGFEMTQGFMEATEAGGRLTSVAKQASPAIDKTSKSMKDAEGSAHGFRRGIDAVRIAMGALVAMALFRTIQFIEVTLQQATKTAEEFETSLYRLANVEKILSTSGVDVSLDSMRKSIQAIKKEFPIVSETDITQIVSLVGIMTKDLGLTETQVMDLTKAIIALNIRSAETEEPIQTAQKVLNSLITSGKGIGTLGISFSETNMKAKAMALGFIEAGDSLEKLTEAQRGQVKLAIVLASTGNEVQNVNDYLKTSVGQVQENTAAWEDFLRVLGEFTLGIKAVLAPALINILHILTDAVNFTKALIVVLQAARNTFDAFIAGARGADLAKVWQNTLEEGFNRFFSNVVPENAPEWFKTLFGKFAQTADTATTGVNALQASLEDIDTSKAQKEIDNLNKDLERLSQREDKLRTNFDIKVSRENADHLTDMARDEQDYQIKRQRFIDDANDRIADRNREYHQRELDNEARFQEQLRQLRERYLYDLEDALRDRDARQVLRLQEKYKMDKEALINEHALQQNEDARRHADDVKQAQEDRDEKLREMDEDHKLEMARKEADFRLKQQREKEDFARELAELEAERQARIDEAAKAIADEYNLKEGAAKALHELLNAYYGPGGAFDGLYDYTNKSMVARAQLMMQQLGQIIGAAQQAAQTVNQVMSAVGAGMGTGGGRPYVPAPSRSTSGALSYGPQAQGGTYLATRPTTATFGEAGAELATFIPLGRPGASGSRLGASLGQEGGKISIEMLLSPDLEARIVENSMNGSAEVILRNMNSK